jgi:hypothetical protein
VRSGNLPEIFQSQVGQADFKYRRQYGDVVRIKGAFGVSRKQAWPVDESLFIELFHQEDRLLISDPKAMQYIFHTSGA